MNSSLSISLNLKIILVLGITVIVLFSVATIVGYQTTDTLLKDHMENQLTSESISRGQALKNLIITRIQLIELFSTNDIIKNLVLETNKKSDGLSHNLDSLESRQEIFLMEVEKFQNIFQSSLGLVELKILGKSGNVMYSSNESDTDYLQSAVFPRGLTESFFQFIQTKEGKRQMVVSTPILETEGTKDNAMGLIVSYLDVQSIDKILLNRDGLGETGEVYLVNNDHILISESRFLENATFDQRVDTLGVIECFENGMEVNDIYTDYRGIAIFGHTYCSKDMGFVLLAEINEDEMFEPITSLQNILLGTSVVVSGGVGIIALYISRTISRPITKLRDAADKITRGDYEHEIIFKSRDEIGQLSHHFNDMRKSILHTITNLKDTESRLEQSLERNKLDSKIIEHQMSELKIINEELIRKEKLKDEFLSMTSHELKTPLTPIMGWCDALKDPEIIGNLTEDQCDAVDAIESNAIKLRMLIDDLLDIQKLELQQMKFKNEDVDLDGICKHVNDDFGFVIKEKQAQLIISKSKIPIFKSDKSRILQVLSALLSNAVDYIPEKNGRIDLDIGEMNNQIIFSVKDNGIGISKENQKLLFKKFYQIDTSHTRKHGGTGLGLAICKGIVDGLGGKIWVESDVGKGAIFYFSIPVR
ncbi:MAG: ATP-binding protein [Nitrosopumilus sp.]|nr:ATP-binding protein [Nitrosopumilus sp.]